jgi:membrane-associated phospholipid phosphatase
MALSMSHWHLVALVYFSYLSVLALSSDRFTRARWPALLATAAIGALAAIGPAAAAGPVAQVVIPSLVLLVAYWVSGLYFTRPMTAVERRLLRMDDELLGRTGILRWYRSGPRVVREYFEVAYLLVYAVVPAGAAVLALNGMMDAVARYWLVVLLAELVCYGMLPWVQTRSPRSIEDVDAKGAGASLIRRCNLAVLGRGSIQANTIPSGHAAGATAVALAVASAMPVAGAVFLVLAASITIATVLGRYHYVADSVLGVLVAAAAWGAVSLAT